MGGEPRHAVAQAHEERDGLVERIRVRVVRHHVRVPEREVHAALVQRPHLLSEPQVALPLRRPQLQPRAVPAHRIRGLHLTGHIHAARQLPPLRVLEAPRPRLRVHLQGHTPRRHPRALAVALDLQGVAPFGDDGPGPLAGQLGMEEADLRRHRRVPQPQHPGQRTRHLQDGVPAGQAQPVGFDVGVSDVHALESRERARPAPAFPSGPVRCCPLP